MKNVKPVVSTTMGIEDEEDRTQPLLAGQGTANESSSCLHGDDVEQAVPQDGSKQDYPHTGNINGHARDGVQAGLSRSFPRSLSSHNESSSSLLSDGDALVEECHEGGSNFLQTTFNLVNLMMGVGLLSLPFALKSSGWVGILLLWLMAFITNYTGKALVGCANKVAELEGKPGAVFSYEQIAEAAFGKIGKTVISTIIYTELFGTCCVLFLLEQDNMFNLFGSALGLSRLHFLAIAAAIMVPTVWLPNVSTLSFLGVFGVAATLSVVSSVAYTLFTGDYPPGAVTHPAIWTSIPLVFGITIFCYAGHGVFPAIQASMKNPSQFPRVLNVAFIIVATICTFVGGAGYYMYGSDAADVIIFNMPGVLAVLCSCLVLINPIAKFAITMEPVGAALSSLAGGGKPLSGLPRLGVRTALALTILVAAKSLPFLAYVMALVGSFMTISVSVTFPSLCHLMLYKGQLTRARAAWDHFVAALGVLCTITGTYASIRSLAAKAGSSDGGPGNA